MKSYLQWLQDSDYSTKCTLCKNELADDEVVRLLCYGKYVTVCPRKGAPQGMLHALLRIIF